VTGAAAGALIAGAVAPGLAAASPDHDGTSGPIEPSRPVVAPESKVKLGDNDTVSGAEAVPHRWFIQLKERPRVAGGSERLVQAEQQTFAREAESLGAELEVTSEYSALWNGVVVEADRTDVEVAAQSDRVVAAFPVYEIERPEPQESLAPQMASAVTMTGVDQVHEMGFTGEGMKIGIIDSGVDVDHPDFGGSGTPTDGLHPDWKTSRIQYGYDLVGDAFNADPSSASYDPVPRPDVNPDDCQGHGTHVAGIAAGGGDPEAGGVVGVAPDATIGAYRVFGCNGSTTAEIMLSAMELAYEDGMHVVNMSIGSAFAAWPQYPTAVAADALVDAGVVVVASIGNSGANGTYSAGAPGVGDKVIGVASFDNVEITLNAVLVGPEATPVGYVTAAGAPTPPTSGELPMARLGDPGTDEARTCTPDGTTVPIEEDLTGQAVLIERGACTFHAKALAAQEAGAEAVVLYNNEPGLLNPTVEGDPAITIPVILVQQEDGQQIDEMITSSEDDVMLAWSDQTTTGPGPGGGLISSFSSYGMTAELQLKPDLGAPGGNIWSTVPLEQGGYANNSGTSMSSPHVAGAVALLLQARPELTPAEVRDVLQNSADPALWWGIPELGLYEPVHRQGAGMLDLDDAVLATTTVSPGKLSLGESEAGPYSTTLKVTNHGDEPVTYTISNDPGSIDTSAPTNDPEYWIFEATLEAPETVTVEPGETRAVPVTITAPENDPSDPENYAPQLQYGGYITLTSGDEVLRVPYAGFEGDYQDIEVLTPGVVNGEEGPFPVLGKLTECDRLIGVDCEAGGTWAIYSDTGTGDEPVFTLVDGDVPTVLAHLEHQARQLTLVAYEANEDGSQGDLVGEVRVDDYLPRSATEGGFFPFTWDGKVEGEIVPDGKYLLEVRVLKALGDPANPEHTETWLSQPFTIADASTPATSPTVERYTGANRYATAARISSEYEPGVEVVYIATGEQFPDALAGAARAAADDAPVLLVREDSVPAPTKLELDRLDPQSIVILGGSGVVSGKVETELASYTTGTVRRVFGPNRYATAAEIAATYESASTVYIASGINFPDALGGSARAGSLDAPVLLTRTDSLPAATAAQLEELGPERIVVLGGPAAVSDSVVDALGEYGEVERQFGPDRYATAAAISGDHEPGVDTVFVASGADFPDALAGSARAGHLDVPVLLVRPDRIPAATLAELERLQATNVVILGGFGAVSEEVEEEIKALTYEP
jgi:putative cell wall-binding protein/subtilisin family serine protease